MGGSSKKQTVGYKYHLGMHMVLCHGPIDFIYQIKVDDREAWKGFADGGEITINKPGLFGGEDREGGVQGDVDILMGGPTQTQNSYLQSRLGDDIPGFRGVVSAVLKRVYLGMNPYLKRWQFRAQRINVKSGGEDQWYKSKAPIGSISNAAVYFALDNSGSMTGITSNGKSRLENMQVALEGALSPLLGLPTNSSIDIMVVSFGESRSTILRRGCDGDDIQEIINFINAMDGSGTATDFDQAVAEASGFFAGSGTKTRTSIFLTDGAPNPADSYLTAGPTLLSINNIVAYGINIDLEDTSKTAYLDNTPHDGVPVAAGGDPSSIESAVANAIFAHFDMNPSHIIRECLTDSVWGMGYLEADMDDLSFMECADKLHAEGMGISLLWDRQIPIEEFVSEIVRHINATLYVDRVTGLFTLKLIRDDYDENSLITLGESNITGVSDYSRIDPGDAINSVSVVYWDFKTGKQASVTVDDVSLIQAYGTVVNTTIQYPGFTNQNIASRAAARDLTTLSTPLLSVSIEANREASQLNIGDVFKFEWPDYHEGYVLMRVMQMALGDGKSNRVKITATEDIFSLASTSVIVEEEPGWVEPGGPPLPPPVQVVQEAPYYELVQLLGQTTVDSQILVTPEIGYLQVAATRPDEGLNAAIWVDAGAGYQDSGPLDFAPTAKLGTSVDREETAWTLTDMEDLDLVEVGSHGQIGEELFRVDAIDPGLGTLTVGRAILDTIPEPHSSGEDVVFWDNYTASDNTEYVDSEVLDVKVLTNSSQGQLDLANGVEDSVTMSSRAIRPYRPANVKAETYLDPPASWFPDYPVNVTWVERNRLQETSGTFLSWTDGTITPEASVEYRVLVEALDESLAVIGTVTDTTTTSTSFSVTDTSINSTYPEAIWVRVTLTTQRDGYNSWTSPTLTFRGPFREPTGPFAVYRDAQGMTKLTGEEVF